jgi:hypothetical protein
VTNHRLKAIHLEYIGRQIASKNWVFTFSILGFSITFDGPTPAAPAAAQIMRYAKLIIDS